MILKCKLTWEGNILERENPLKLFCRYALGAYDWTLFNFCLLFIFHNNVINIIFTSPTITFFSAINKCKGSFRKQECLAPWDQKGHVQIPWLVNFNPLCQFFVFFRSGVTVIMSDDSKKHFIGWILKFRVCKLLKGAVTTKESF